MKPMSTMNVIPFIDIMLVLLAVVLTTATFVAQGKIPVNLPSAEAADVMDMQPAVEITVSAQGELSVEESVLSVEALRARLEALSKDTPVRVRVDEAAAFQHFVLVIDLLKATELSNLSIVTAREEK